MDENIWSNDLDSELFSRQVYDESKLNGFMKPLLKIQSKMTMAPEDISRNRELKYTLFVLI